MNGARGAPSTNPKRVILAPLRWCWEMHLFKKNLSFWGTPWKINGWNLQPSPMKRKDNDLNQTSRDKMFHVNLPCRVYPAVGPSFWDFRNRSLERSRWFLVVKPKGWHGSHPGRWVETVGIRQNGGFFLGDLVGEWRHILYPVICGGLFHKLYYFRIFQDPY